MSRNFNFDDFDGQIADALEGAEVIELAGRRCIEEDERVLRPGEIGAVVCTPLFSEWFGPEPPDAA